MEDISKGLIEQSGEVLVEAYKDIVHPTAESLGQVISYLPRTIRLGLSKWEKWIVNGEESLKLTALAVKDKVDKIPLEKQCEPEPYVAVPAIQQISYCFDNNELREMYANLLASSMNLDKKWEVHPSYVDIIKQLTPDEAKLLQYIPNNVSYAKPLIDLLIDKSGNGKVMVCKNYSDIGNSICAKPENISMYLENLDRLKIIEIVEGTFLTDSSVYLPLENCEYIQKKMQNKDIVKYKFERKIFRATSFGVGFINTCVGDNSFINGRVHVGDGEE